jgi:hypothetical protein
MYESGINVTFFIMPVNRHVRRVARRFEKQHTSFPFGERYMTSRFILDVLNLNLSSPRLFILWLGDTVVVVVVFSATLHSIMISDERVVTNRSRAREWNSMTICWGGISYMVKGSLAFSHSGRRGREVRGRRQVGLLDIEHGHLDIVEKDTIVKGDTGD